MQMVAARTLLAASVLLPVAPSGTPTAQRPAAAEVLADLERRMAAEEIRGSRTLADRTLAEDYVGVSAAGKRRSKAEILADYDSGRLRYSSIDIEQLEVKLLGRDGAAVLGVAAARGSFDGRAFAGRFRIVRVYARRAGGWIAVAGQSTPVAE